MDGWQYLPPSKPAWLLKKEKFPPSVTWRSLLSNKDIPPVWGGVENERQTTQCRYRGHSLLPAWILKLLYSLFLTFGVLVANPQEKRYTMMAIPTRGLLNREERRTRRESLAAYPPPPNAARSEKIKYKNYVTHLHQHGPRRRVCGFRSDYSHKRKHERNKRPFKTLLASLCKVERV